MASGKPKKPKKDALAMAVAVTYIGGFSSSTGANSYNAGNFNAATAGLMVVFFTEVHGNAANPTATVSIGGTNGTNIDNPHGNSASGVSAYRSVSSGNQNVTVSLSATLGTSVRVRIDVFLITGHLNDVPFGHDSTLSTSTVTTVSTTPNTPAGGAAIMQSHHAAGSGGVAWSSATEDSDVIVNSASCVATAHINPTSVETPHTETTTASSSNRQIILSASWETLAPTDVTDSPDAGSIVMTGYLPDQSYAVTPAAGSIVLTGYAVTEESAITPAAGSIVLTGGVPLIAFDDTPDAAQFALTGAPTTEFVGHEDEPDAASSALTGAAPSVAMEVPAGAASITVTGAALLNWVSLDNDAIETRLVLEVTYSTDSTSQADATRLELEAFASQLVQSDITQLTIEVFHSQGGAPVVPIEPHPRETPIWSIIRHAL